MFIMFNNSNPKYRDGTTDKCYFTQGFHSKVSIAVHALKAYCQPLPFIVKDLIESLPFWKIVCQVKGDNASPLFTYNGKHELRTNKQMESLELKKHFSLAASY
jgi:hypothetical protein